MVDTVAGGAKFRQPPLTEVAIAIEFLPAALNTVTLVRLWQRWQEFYPRIEEQLPVPAFPDAAFMDGTGLHISQGPEPRRIWMISADGSLLIQIQHDRLVLNWRVIGGSAYPPYEDLRELYAGRWSDLVTFIDELQMPVLEPVIADVTFVNRIEEVQPNLLQVSPVFQEGGTAPAAALAGTEVENTAFRQSCQVAHGGRTGRLLLDLAYVPDDQSASLTITTRMRLNGEKRLEHMMEALDSAHEIGVKAFVDVTRPKFHEIWKRYR